MVKSNKKIQFFLILILLLVFLRVDYRFTNTIKCCSDEYDYFLHASTIALDFDLDYSNQNPRDFRYYNNGKNTPIGFIGSGILSSPFLLFGNFLSKIFSEDLKSEIFNFKIFFYSFSSVFYFFFSYFLLHKILNLLKIKFNKYFLLLIFSGSGITYYAFERYGITHIYEVFTVTLIIYSSIRCYISKNKKYNIHGILLPIFLLIAFLTRMSNFYIFLIPLIIKNILIKNQILIKHSILKDFYFLGSALVNSIIYYFISKSLYGELIINPQKIYGTNIDVVNTYIIENFFDTFLNLLKTFFNVLVTMEFGIFWVSPILFIGLISPLINLQNLKKINTYLILFCFAQNFFIIHLWQALGSSYGFRYLFSLTPLSIIVYYVYSSDKILIKNYLFFTSIFSNLSILFFETTELTQLSTVNEVNSFGRFIRYVEPNYVNGLLGSFFEINSYLIIFTTSFLGALFFKLLLVFFNIELIINGLGKLNLPVDNPDFINYLETVNIIKFNKFIVILTIFALVSYFFVYKLREFK